MPEQTSGLFDLMPRKTTQTAKPTVLIEALELIQR